MSNSTQARPKAKASNNLVAYNQSLKRNAKTAGYFGNSEAAQKKREQFLTKYYEAAFSGKADSMDLFELDAVRLNMSQETATKIYKEVLTKLQQNTKAASKQFRIFNGANVENQLLYDLRNYNNFRSSVDAMNYTDERTKSDKSYNIFISCEVIYDVRKRFFIFR